MIEVIIEGFIGKRILFIYLIGEGCVFIYLVVGRALDKTAVEVRK